MKKHKKYRILGVVFLLTVALSVGLLMPTYAVDNNASEAVETPLTCQDLVEKYGLYIKEGSSNNQYILIRDPQASCEKGDKIPTDGLKLTKINGVAQDGTKQITGDRGEITFSAVLLGSGKSKYITVEVQSLKDKNINIQVRYDVSEESSISSTLGTETNTNYNGVCATFRNEVAGMSADAQSFFQDSVAYCWKASVLIGTNYTQEETRDKINSAKASWNAFNAGGTNQSQTFTQAFNSIKANAAKVPGHSITISSNPTFSLKCRYDYVKKSGASYTNAYGETVSSDTDYYLNKDYYLGTQTTYSGKDWEYTYNYAPGNTKKVKLNNGNPTCERTCEEAVKVEYGPPVASKAGLCFEYKVKVTSYVTCKTKFTANRPDSNPGYCSPAPRCRSVSGVERVLPQAGPSQEFDSCIEKCDGGKYTQSCSKKCYNEVYAGKNGSSKLAISYDTAKVQGLSFSLKSCLNEANKNELKKSVCYCLNNTNNENGCYYYDGNTVKWKSRNHNWNTTAGLGRWYIIANRQQGYNLSGLSNGTYVADESGFYRHNINGELCTDICNWRSDSCGSSQYLNQGTISTDLKANEKVYEAARTECAAGVTCSSRTADITISINYDTKEDSGNIKKTTIKFPYTSNNKDSIEKDSISSKGENNEGKDTFTNKYSTLLDRDGCYTSADEKNWYLAEWSFPGTYIHNKTGEISFKVPGDTSGWYYEDKKFCMPLNALSVNSKWWEWYKIANANFADSCYTKDQIEAELATNDNTSNGYNIKATATNFGYFGWNFNIGCFYGLRNEVCNIDDESTKKCCTTDDLTCTNPPCDKTTKGLDNYVVRTVDRANLFPNRTVSSVVSENTRPIGFNWTSDAKILELKNPNYHVDPVALIQEIEGTADQLHSVDSYLDYQFYLTPTTLRKIRQYNKKYAYGAWNGTTKTVNGVNVYLSNLWNSAEGSIESNINLHDITGTVLKTGDPGVNNE